MRLAHGHPFLGTHIMADPARAAAICNAPVIPDRVPLHYPAVFVGVVNERLVHPDNCPVVCEMVLTPLSADEADAHVTEAVIHASVVAHMPAPVSIMEHVEAVVPAPIRRRPERTLVRGGYPRPGYPIVAIVAICPVTGRPHQALFRAGRLFINRQHRGRKSHTDKYSRKRRSGDH
jgi:hypothetical protein